MAYESQTYETILARMMARVSANYPNLDTREGSVLFNALAPAALELAVMYTELDNVLKESFVNTASREYILIGCEQMGMDISQFEASPSVHKGEFDVEVTIGSRWNCDLYNFTVTEYIGKNGDYYTYRMKCESAGSGANNQTGNLTPITDVPIGLTYAKITECLIEGENETSDEDIRTAYYEFVNSAVSNGNVAQYKRWCSEYKDENGVRGIGNAKIFPLWNNQPNTVKVSILSASNTKASEVLVRKFQEYLDPGSKGMGDGVAPIGAFVTVSTANEVYIDVAATISMKEGYTDTTVIDKALEDYFSEIAYEKSTVSYMSVGAVILNVEGVDRVDDLYLNGGQKNINLDQEDIPVLGTTDWTVV